MPQPNAKVQPPLTTCLYNGFILEQHILDILQMLWTCKITVIAEVEKAFLMITISEKD